MNRSLPWIIGFAALVLAAGCRSDFGPDADGLGVFLAGERSSAIKLRAADGRLLSIEIAASSGLPVAGDWDGDGRDTVGYFEPSVDAFHLSDDFGEGAPQFSRLLLGWDCPACYPVAGDFGGLGVDGIGLYDPSRGLFLLRDRAESRSPIRRVTFGEAGVPQLPVAGRFTACPEIQLGLYEPSSATFRVRGCRAGDATRTFRFGPPHGLPVTGRWQREAFDGVGVFDPAAGRFLLRAAASEGPADLVVPFFHAPAMPIAGRWSFSSH